MNKYLMVIMCCMLIGIPIAYVDPTEGGLREEPYTGLFFVSIGGATVSYTHLTLPTTPYV